MSQRKVTQYAEEFKRSWAKLALSSSQSISQSAKELGVNKNTLHGWVNKYYPRSDTSGAVEGSSIEVMKQLRQENARLKQEREILKKAAAYFAKESV